MSQFSLKKIQQELNHLFRREEAEYKLDGEYHATDVAQYALWYCKQRDIAIKQKDLQVILYILQMYSLREKREAFFRDDFIARSSGPVILDVSLIYLRGKAPSLTDLARPVCVFSEEAERTIRLIVDSYFASDAGLRSRFAKRKHGAWETIYRDGKGFGKYIPKKEIVKESQGLKRWGKDAPEQEKERQTQ